MEIKVLETRTQPTVQIIDRDRNVIMHSKYDPVREANDWAVNAMKLADPKERIVIVGLAAGYHIEALSRLLSSTSITLIELNSQYFHWFMQSEFSKRITEIANVEFYEISDLNNEQINGLFMNLPSGNLLIQKNALEICPETYLSVKELILNIKLHRNSYLNQREGMERNFQSNVLLKDPGIRCYSHDYSGRPALLVSAGPSLDKQLSLLKEIRRDNKIVIGSVGTSVKSLLAADILPDFFIITDPNYGTLSQLQDIYLPKTPLFYLCTAYHETVIAHQGPRYILFQDGYGPAEQRATERNEPLVRTGGSVSTTLLDLASKLNIRVIGLVGQDLAFTNGVSHTSSAPLKRGIDVEGHYPLTLNYYQTGMLPTSKNLLAYKYWMERYAENSSLSLYNCTEGGAYINNWKHIALHEFYETYHD